ncbi:MAG TPA: MFS transporter [Firmicutes bacterium]|nr:MFS transporter [Bacillota bacterium]
MSNIILLGIVSFMTDLSSEMVYPIIPLYLTAVFGATPAIVGLIEGIAESLASLLKVFSGYWADRYKNKKRLTLIGYSASFFYKVALLLAASWPGVLAARIVDRVGKGIRTAPRDVLIAESANAKKLGGSFGLHKMLDMLGSALGILASYFLLRISAGGSANIVGYRRIFLISTVPAVLGVLALLLVKERKSKSAPTRKLSLNFRTLDGRLKAFLIIVFLFTLGNSSNAFLLLRASSVGFDAQSVILMYFLFNIVASLLAYPLGRLSDRIGRRALLVGGYLIYGLVYIGFAYVTTRAGMIALFAAYGIYTAMTAGTERALITEIAPANLRGTMLGLHGTLVGIGLLPASLIAGFLWNTFGAAAPFRFGGILGLAAAVAVAFVLNRRFEARA